MYIYAYSYIVVTDLVYIKATLLDLRMLDATTKLNTGVPELIAGWENGKVQRMLKCMHTGHVEHTYTYW